jgi:Xaa-Pro aminopeptidase
MSFMHAVFRYLLVALIALILSPCLAQEIIDAELRGDYLTKEFHAGRRAALRKLMPDHSVAVIFAYPERVFSNDVNYVYHPNPDLYYFSGYREADAVLLIFKEQQDTGNQSYNELFFVRKRDPKREQWTGRRLGIEGVKTKLGFKSVFNGEDFASFPIDFKKFKVVIHDVLPVAERNNVSGELSSLVDAFRSKSAIDQKGMELFTAYTNALREIKTPEELVLMKKSVEISAAAHVEVMKAITPDLSEREIEGIMLYVHKKYGAEGEGYPPIIGAGANGCILHYQENELSRLNNQLLLMDVGSEYHGYSADVTRTVPANGKFSTEQRAIYELVYEAQEEVIKLCKAGVPYKHLEMKTLEVLSKGLMKLGIINEAKEVRRYYMHGVSHFLGLDVHDKGNYESNLKENMVITVEPGIYISADSPCDKKWWNIAVRIEDDIVIGKNGGTNLSAGAPRKWDDVEKMTKQQSFFDAVNLPAIK